MNKYKEIIDKTVTYVKDALKNAEAGHDWLHIERVWHSALTIGKHEDVDMLIVELGALLHDIADAKFYGGDESVGPAKARQFMSGLSMGQNVIDHVVKIIENISYKGGNFVTTFKSTELDVVQDADRLDAIGAIGIARAFTYGGHKGRSFYDKNVLPKLDMTKEEYKNTKAPTINHFYEKLLLLKDRFNTSTGKKMAQQRHDYMVGFLKQFYQEAGISPDLYNAFSN